MNNTVRCKNCGKEGSFNEIKLYNISSENEKSQFLCQECYQKIISKNQKVKKCPSCNISIFYDATWCPYCGESIIKTQKTKKYCISCGAEISENTNYCPVCGEFTNDSYRKEPNLDKKHYVKPKKMLSISIAIIFFITLFFGFQAFMNTNTSQNIFSTFNPDAVFNLISSEFMDYQGEVALKINYLTNDEIELKILDDNYTPISSTTIKKDESIKLIKTPSFQDKITGGYYTIIAKSGTQKIFEKTIYYKGPLLRVNYPTYEWECIKGRYADKLKNISITASNVGDMPVYISNLQITIDELNGPHDCKINEEKEKVIILPQETKTIIFTTDEIPTVQRMKDHTIEIELVDINGQIISSDS